MFVLLQKVELLEDRVSVNSFFKQHGSNYITQNDYKQYLTKKSLEENIKEIKRKLKESEDVILKANLKGMKRLLRR